MKKDYPLIKINKIMTMKEIEKKFKKHWVIIDEPERDSYNNTLKGKLLYCCRSKPKIASKLDQLNLKKCDFYYIGPMEEDLAYIYKHIQ